MRGEERWEYIKKAPKGCDLVVVGLFGEVAHESEKIDRFDWIGLDRMGWDGMRPKVG